MAKMLAASRPNKLPWNNPRKMPVVAVRNPRMGSDCKKSSSGTNTFSARGSLAGAVA
ncbi:Uncharacterised protein [Klebsiella pneumoniae]|nr:Uncharacterised protein [Klebsiella pneumoniae]